jgi:hypothetical protein
MSFVITGGSNAPDTVDYFEPGKAAGAGEASEASRRAERPKPGPAADR